MGLHLQVLPGAQLAATPHPKPPQADSAQVTPTQQPPLAPKYRLGGLGLGSRGATRCWGGQGLGVGTERRS